MTTSRKIDHKSSAMREFDLGRGVTSVHRAPVDAGQIVDVRYGQTASYIVRIEHDRSDDTVVVEAYHPPATGVYEPWNGRVDLGRRVGVIFYGSRAELAL